MSHSLEEVHGSNFVLQSYISQKNKRGVYRHKKSMAHRRSTRTTRSNEKNAETKINRKEKIEIKKKGKDDRRDEGFATLFLDPYIFQLRK